MIELIEIQLMLFYQGTLEHLMSYFVSSSNKYFSEFEYSTLDNIFLFFVQNSAILVVQLHSQKDLS